MPTTSELLDLAINHLAAAATAAEDHDTHAPGAWAALAGQIRLTAAGIPALPATDDAARSTALVHQHLDQAVDALDHIDTLDGPADLPLWTWHLTELARLAQQLEAA